MDRNTPGMLIGASVMALCLMLILGAVTRAEGTHEPEGYTIGMVGNWPTSCTPGGPYVSMNTTSRIIYVWQETSVSPCERHATEWRATISVPPGDWRIVWTIDARDGSADRRLQFVARDNRLHRVWLPVVWR